MSNITEKQKRDFIIFKIIVLSIICLPMSYIISVNINYWYFVSIISKIHYKMLSGDYLVYLNFFSFLIMMLYANNRLVNRWFELVVNKVDSNTLIKNLLIHYLKDYMYCLYFTVVFLMNHVILSAYINRVFINIFSLNIKTLMANSTNVLFFIFTFMAFSITKFLVDGMIQMIMFMSRGVNKNVKKDKIQ